MLTCWLLGIMEGSFLEEFFGDSVNVNGFKVLKKNAPMIQEIFSKHPNIASGLRVHFLTSINVFMNTLAVVCKTATKEKVTWEEIELMEKGIVVLELAGFEISWLKLIVVQHREEVERNEKIESMEAQLKVLKENQNKLIEEHKSKRQTPIRELFTK
ncbi:MATH domain and coiled-coil domain-containing protein At3g58220-like [Durio zibethinus]|uniref:MATH domain and coiled-coil domain-containing protein At3g58220-like n=1 Tax=Durio zibethinus TaxID=66656 RepID=A0A6P6AXQ0_DURZI|nr:MATH domain and coiled-coil domain-containing protein At3g58220-like [Durio zibethinus]